MPLTKFIHITSQQKRRPWSTLKDMRYLYPWRSDCFDNFDYTRACANHRKQSAATLEDHYHVTLTFHIFIYRYLLEMLWFTKA